MTFSEGELVFNIFYVFLDNFPFFLKVKVCVQYSFVPAVRVQVLMVLVQK